MKKQFGILIFLSLFVITGCNAKSVEKDTALKLKVEPCGFDYDIDDYYCKADKLNLYKKILGIRRILIKIIR